MDMMYLFTTKTCPNCKLAKEYLKNEKYVLIDAAENMELAGKYGIMQAPTLVVVNGDGFKKYVNIFLGLLENQDRIGLECNLFIFTVLFPSS